MSSEYNHKEVTRLLDCVEKVAEEIKSLSMSFCASVKQKEKPQ